MLLILILAFKNIFTKEESNSQLDEYDHLTFGPVSGNYEDSNYLSLHKIDKNDFKCETSGDRDGNSISNAFDDNDKSFWVSKDPETDSFHPYVIFNFSSQILFEGFVYRPGTRLLDNIQYYDGFPAKLKLYAATSENEPLKLRAVFTGEQSSASKAIQFVLNNPVLCTQLKLEFHDVSVAKSFDSEQKLAATREFALYKTYEYDLIRNAETNGIYKDSNYINFHKIRNFESSTNGDSADGPFSNALDDSSDTNWISKEPESVNPPTIYINFTEQILFEGLIYGESRYKKKWETSYTYIGFPARLSIYTALGDEPFKVNSVFIGKQEVTSVQFILSKPVKCSRLKIVLQEVSDYKGEGNHASADSLVFLQSYDYDQISYQNLEGEYNQYSYLQFHTIKRESFSIKTNGDNPGYTIENTLDPDLQSSWNSISEENDTFRPTIYVNFTEAMPLQAIVYNATYQDKKFYGFPGQLLLYTALGDEEPLKARYVFQGSPSSQNVLVKLPEVINCTRIKLEFYNLSPIKAGGKFASSNGFQFIRTYDYDQISYQNLEGVYGQYSYLQFHTIKREGFSIKTNGDNPDYTIENTLDPDLKSSWNSISVESDTFRPTIYVNFTEATPFEALVYNATSEKENYYGFPKLVLLYTALGDDEPLTPRVVFRGEPRSSNMLLRLTKPIVCKKIKFELYYITEIKAGGRYASSNGFQFIRTFDYEQIDSQKADGIYRDSNFIDSHTIRTSSFSIRTNKDNDQYPIENTVNGADNDWNSGEEESDTFRPQIYLNFNEPTLFQGFLYDLVYEKPIAQSNKYYGFPSLVLLYTALNDDEPLTPKVIFRGEASDPQMQFILSQPINCKRIELEFYYVSGIKADGKKIASAKKFTFLHSFDYEQIRYQQAKDDVHLDSHYLNLHSITVKSNLITTNGDREGSPITNILDSSYSSTWISAGEESDTYHPTIFVNFTEPTLFDGLILVATSHRSNLVVDREYYGFPRQTLLYTATDDEKLTPKVLFHGNEKENDNEAKFLLQLAEPINCTRIKLELSYITDLKNNGGKYASVDEIYFLQTYNYEKFENVKDKYINVAYIDSNKLIPSEMKCDYESESAPIKNLFESGDSDGKYWESGKANDENWQESITSTFNEPVFIEALVMKGKDGFPLLLKVYASLDDSPLTLRAIFSEGQSINYDNRIQFVLPKTIHCTKIKIEFTRVTKYNNANIARLDSLFYISTHSVIYYSNNKFTDDQESVNVSDNFLWNEVSNSSFTEYYLPKQDDYLFVVGSRKDEIKFYNNSFESVGHKVGAIKSQYSSSVFIDKCKFTKCTVKNEDVNGGALNFLNCPIQCERSDFIECISIKGGKGGAIYITISDKLHSDSLIEDCSFTKCSAVFGGGVYAYSNDPNKEIVISHCSFISNTNHQAQNEKPSGSAIYMNAVKSSIVSCKFKRNVGADSVRVVYNFPASAAALDEQKHVVVKDCSFEIDSNSKASLSLLHESDSVVPISIDNCIFNGELSNGAHHIDGNVIKNKNQLNLLNVVSCKFSTGKNGALKLNGRSYSSDSLDESKQEFLLGLQRKSKKSNIGVHLAFLVIGALVVASAIISLIVAIRKRSNDNNEI